MDSGSGSASSLQPLSVGNSVNTVFKLYREKFKEYLPIAFYATAWVFGPVIATIAVVGFFFAVQSYYSLLGLIIPVLVLWYFYALAKYTANAALISRLAFGEIINQPETLRDAQRYITPRLWSFFRMSFVLGLIYTGIWIAFYLILILAFVALIVPIGGLSVFTNPNSIPSDSVQAIAGAFLLFFLLFLVALVGFLVLFLWVAARFAIPELPLVLEADTTAVRSISRTWELTKGNAWRIVGVIIITYLVTTPLQFVAQIAPETLRLILPALGVTPESPLYQILVVLSAYALGLALGMLVLPLWQIMKAVIYCDLRTRREGFGLQFRDRGS